MQSDSLINEANRSSSSFNEASADESDPLIKQRQRSLVPKSGELSVSVSELEWSDLLLEIAMTTAFASLTDGTPILETWNIASYLSFFALVWWVWASQVAYNIRFRQADWLHRMFIFFQVFVFCALAAFTNNFNITNGITDDSKEQQQISQLETSAMGGSEIAKPLLDVENFRDNLMLPTLNVRGISVTMACSRLLLLVQYSTAFYHCVRRDGGLQFSRQSAFVTHIGSLILSSLCYFIAFGVIGRDPDKDDQIAKIFLWYIPLFIEIGAHYLAISNIVRGRVPYDSKQILARSSSVFVITLGGGLDMITEGFQFIVGNVWNESFELIFCGVVVFLLLFSLYFGTGEPGKLSSRRSISLLFFQFFYLAAIIVTLQGIASMLEAGNLGNALELPFDFLTESKFLMEIKGSGVHLNESDYIPSNLEMRLKNQGVSLTTMLNFVNDWMDIVATNTSVKPEAAYNALLQMDVYAIENILFNLKKYPDSGLLVAQLDAFYSVGPEDFQNVNNKSFNDLAERVVVSNATPALWFYAAGGSVLVALGLMGLIRQWPRDKYEWGQIISRLLMGSAIITFTAIDVHASSDVLDENFRYQGSKIWYLATHSWVLPIYALALLIEQITELILLYLAGRSISSYGFSGLNRSLSRVVYSKTKQADHDEFIYAKGEFHGEPEAYFDSYTRYDSTEKGLTSSPDNFVPIHI
ncbi:hypothetical protein VKT23_013788 [Stygiomarasmius scandens]|uniref:Uncharacterized protein n=1 Tax=Marasmiellus scandens TaxID=2682957 RepID=A0ABR1J577_9AGAR